LKKRKIRNLQLFGSKPGHTFIVGKSVTGKYSQGADEEEEAPMGESSHFFGLAAEKV